MRRGRRLLRLAVLVTVGWFVLAGWAPAASAMPLRWPSLSGLGAWLAGSPPLRVPVEHGGTAAGRPHYVPARANRVHGGAGRRPGRGPGQLPPYHPYSPTAHRYLTRAFAGVGFNPVTSHFVASASTATASFYRNRDGSYTKMVYPGQVNYRTASGTYRPISTALVAAGHRWRETANSVAVSVASLASDRAVGLVGFSGGQSAGFGLAGAAPVAGTVTGPVITYPGVLTGTDLRETVAADGIGSSLVVHSASAASTWLFPLRLRGLTAAPASGGVISLRNVAGTAVAEVTPAAASDARLSAGAVTEQVVPYQGGQALQVSLNRAWLTGPARVFPVTVSVGVRGLTKAGGATGSTYVDSGYRGDNSGAPFLRVGTYRDARGVLHSDRALLHFSDVASGLRGYQISAASLHLFNTWSATCAAPHPFAVHQVTSRWRASDPLAWPGPSLGPQMGSLNVTASGAACGNTSGSQARGAWRSVPLTQGLPVLNAWARHLGTDMGLAVTAGPSLSQYKQFDGGNAAPGSQPYLELTFIATSLPQIDSQYPPNNYSAPSLTPELMASGSGGSGSLKYQFTIDDSSGNQVAQSDWDSSSHYRPPSEALAWNQTYYWFAQATDGTNYSTVKKINALSTSVPQPAVTSGLSQNTGGQGFDPANSDYTTSATDAQVSVTGPALAIERYYNSEDPRTTGAFGAGWSSVLDARVSPGMTDIDGNVETEVVTYPDGEQVGFGVAPDGKFTAPEGRFATLASASPAGYTLIDKNDTVYTFTQSLGGGAYGITSITDAIGHALNFNWTSGQITQITSAVSQRSLYLTWSGGFVAKVTTGLVNPNDPNSALTWNYTYGVPNQPDALAKVCPPNTTNCTTYSYQQGTDYPATVMDTGPHSFWPLDEAPNATTAASSVLVNEGADNGTYSNVTLGDPGPLPSAASNQTSAGFNGTSSSVTLPGEELELGATYQTVSLWFKTSASTAGVLYANSAVPITGTWSQGDPFTPELYVGSNGYLYGEFWNGDSDPIKSTNPVNDGNWHQAVLTSYNSSTGDGQALYVDGVQVGTESGTVSNTSLDNDYIGAGFIGQNWPEEPHMGNNPAPVYFNGQIADAGFWDRSLNSGEISAMYQAGTGFNSLLTQVTRPSGSVYAKVGYDPGTGAVTSVTDDNGGTWQIGAPADTGSSQVYASAVLGQHPVDYWRLGDAGTTTAVNQVVGGTATYSSVTQGVTGGPFSDTTVDSFDGTSSYIALPQGLVDATGNQSVSLWFKTSTAGGVLFGYAQNPIGGSSPTNFTPALYVGSNGDLEGEFWNGSSDPMQSSSEVDDNEWHNAVLAAEGNAQTLYLDGKKVGSESATISQPGPQPYVYVGSGFNGGGWPSEPNKGNPAVPQYFSGLMGDVSFYNSELSAAQVSEEYNALQFSHGLTPVQTVHVTDPGGNTLAYVMDPLNGNRLISQTDALGNTTRYGYDTGGFLNTTVDPNGLMTITGHDVRGNQVSQTTCQNQAQNLCSTSYDSYYPDDTSTSPSPDPRNDLPLTERGPGSASDDDNTYLTTYAYDKNTGQLTSVTTPPVPGFPQGRTTTTAYTDGTMSFPAFDNPTKPAPAGLPATETSPGGAVTTAKYDVNGDLAEVINPDGLVTQYTYDGIGRLASQKVVSSTYPNGLTTSYTYNAVGELKTETSPAVTDRVTGAVHTAQTTTVYDPDGDVTSQTVADTSGGDASRTVTNTYNPHDQLITSTDPAGATTQYSYDAYGNLATETNPAGDVKQYAYDPNGHLKTVTLENYTGNPSNPQPPAPLVESSRAYYPNGWLASITDAMGNKTAYTYFDNGLLETVTRSNAAGTASFTEQSNTYNAADQLTQQVTNNGAATTSYNPDAAGRNTSVTVDPAVLDRTTTYAYSPDDQVVNQTLTGPGSSTPVQSTSYTYDPMGNMTSQSRYLKGGGDPLGWWRLDQTSGTAVPDSSGVGNNATATNVTWSGNAGVFDGSSSYAATQGPVLDTTGSFTVSAWANMAGNTGTDQGVVSQPASEQDGFRIQYSAVSNPPTWAFDRTVGNSSGSAKVYAQGTAAVTTGTWYHLVGTYDAATGTMTFYVNGTQVGTATDTTPFAADGPLTIGRDEWNGANSNYFDGSISDVQVYQRALSAAEVSALYQAGRDGGANPSNKLTTTWALDQRGLPTSMTDPNGNTTYYTYDEAGRLAVTTSPAVATQVHGQPVTQVTPITMTGYNTFGEPVETKDPNGNVTVTAYDADGHPVSVTQPPYTPPGSSTPINAVTTTGYNNLGEMTSQTNPLGGTTAYTYDQLGDTASVTNPDGGVTTYTYDTNGNQLMATGPTGAVTSATYDYMGRMATSTEEERYPAPAAYTTNYSYGFGGWLSSKTLPPTPAAPNGVTTSYTYNAAGEKASETDGAGNTTTYGYDPAGELTSTTYPNGSASTYGYDAVGRVIGQADLGTGGAVLRSDSNAYDGNGNLVSATDYNGNTTSFTYDAGNRLASETQPVTATSGITTSFGYDAAGNRTLYVDGNANDWWTTYNSWNLPEKRLEPDTAAYTGSTFTTSYDADRNPVSVNEPGGVSITNTYNNMDQLTGQSGSGTAIATTTRSFGYDPAGNLTSAATTAAGSAPATSENFTYDDRGLPLTATGTAGSTTYGYNGDDQVSSVADAAGTTSYTYDAAGRLATMADPLTGTTATYSYNTLSQVNKISYGTGNDVRTLTYNGLHRLNTDKLATASGQAVASISYGYDPNGNLTSKTTTGFAGPAASTYTYDEANRLTSWNNGTSTVSYGYDGAGNRTQAGNQTLVYDARDQVTSTQAGSGPATTYTYTARGTLKSVTSSSGTVNFKTDAYGEAVVQGPQSFTYDGLGGVVTDSGTGGSFNLTYAGPGRQVASDGAWNYTYDPSGGLAAVGPAGGTTSQGVLAYTDLHTDVVGTFAPAGSALAGSAAYSPLGAVTASSGLAGNLGYQSAFTDPANSEVNMGARWYAPATGEFTTRDTAITDPVPDPAAANPFAYAGDNPMTGTDPTGHYLIGYGPSGGTAPPPRGHTQPPPAPAPQGCSWWDPVCNAVHVYHAYVVPAFHAVVHVVVVSMTQGLRNVTGLLARGLALAGHLARDGLIGIADAARSGAHAIGAGWHQAVAAGAAAVHSVTRWAVTTYHQAAHAVGTAWHAVAKAASAVAAFVKNHAATIASFAVSAAVFVGCDAALGITTAGVGALAGAAACGALAGAAGNAVAYGITAAQTGHFSWTGLAGSAATGALAGAAGGLAGGLFASGLSAIGDAATSLLSDGAQTVSADAAANAAATGANDAAAVATNDAPSTAATDAATGAGNADTSLANAAEDAGSAAARGPSFIARSNGEVIRIPEGATGPTPTDNGLGFQFRGGSGGDPLDPRVTGVRVMDPVTSGKYLYPNGYVSYENGVGQTVNPFTGQTISPSDPFWHWALEP